MVYIKFGTVSTPKLLSLSAYAESPILSVYFIDVGQGDATLILSGDSAMLVDTGPDGGLSALRDRLDASSVDQIDYLVLTHPHEDHDANLAYLADNYAKAYLVMPEYADDEEDYGSLLREMVSAGTQIVYPNVGDQYAIGKAIATVLSAPDPGQFPTDENLWSLVIRVDCCETSVMLTGDAEDINEFAMIDAGLLQHDQRRAGERLGVQSCRNREGERTQPVPILQVPTGADALRGQALF